MEQFFKKLELLYIAMDKAFDKAALHYKFKCNGCEDNCCKSFFYHHTFIEKDYILSKIKNFPKDDKKNLKQKADLYLETIFSDNKNIKRPLCPLNKNNLCILYNERPMICRLHGIPHHLGIPGSKITQNPGCDAGALLFNSTSYYSFDRIPYYKKMAELEKQYKNAIGKTEKIKQTIAHMLLDI
jgi:Fe-S-cluster containining protein